MRELPAPNDAVLSQPIASLALPTRMKRWAERNGLILLGELTRHRPDELLAEPNLGRTSIRRTQHVIEQLTGRTWDQLCKDPLVVSTNEPPPPRLFASPWDAFRARLTEDQRGLLLSAMVMPSRLRTFVEGKHLITLGELAARSSAELLAAPNLGRTTIATLPALVRDHLVATEQAHAVVDRGLLECFLSRLESTDPMLRLIATRRACLAGETMTLQELGDTLGMSRERIRQLEGRLCEQLVHQPWALLARQRIEAALATGPVPLSILARDRWWAAASQQPGAVEFIVENVLRMNACVIELDDAAWLSRTGAADIEARWASLIGVASELELPAPLAALDALVEEAAAGQGPHLAAYYCEKLRAQLQISDGEPARVLAFGDNRRAELLALLQTAAQPLHIEDLERRLGRRLGKLPEEAICFGQGRIGVRRHFADFDTWQARLVPAAVELIEEQGPERQWHCTELVDELREQLALPAWMTGFALAALIKARPDSLRYLGRLRVVLPSKQDLSRRVFVHDAIAQLLLDAGEPVPRTVLLDRLQQRMGISEHTAMILGNPLFVRVDHERIGLLTRDVPGGMAAIAEASAHMEGVLTRRGLGLSAFRAREELAQLSPTHATWTSQLAMSALRTDDRFRLSQSGAVGLSCWESTRVPTRTALFRDALAASSGCAAVEDIVACIEAHYGDRPSRATLASMAMNAGARLDGAWITRKKGE